MLKIVMDLNSSNVEIVVLERNDRPVKANTISAFLSGMANIPEEFQELFFKYLVDKQNRATMKMLLQEEAKCKKNIEKLAYIKRLKEEIVRNWSE